ncbi:hypothetical protein A1OK_08595 [Enterovibrio norvegicus FF-454]|uniref:DUF4136 domain-containing protein n=1 Tax=Enterovibrio norvegicus FF-454 TaxID=1185651 RepID=A0A1E5C8N5_9GAMM|nr:DUF4136 domain-containing protein [Enterovibrio norvegicus]OEE61807.1 hypothetical protein A1OK_08595 [Enterovibrio norvegicus FF-454]
MHLRLVSLLFISVLAGCAKSVYTDYDQQYPYSDIQSFNIVAHPSSVPISLDDSRIKRAVEEELRLLGLTEADNAPSVNIRYFIESKTESVAYGPSFRFGYGFNRIGIGYETPVRVEERDYGQLVVEMVDPITNQVIWRAISNRKLTDNMTPSSKNVFIQEQVKEMFKQFPPDKSS